MFLDRLDILAQKARPWIPFTALNTVWRMLDKEARTVLDIGCGKGEPMRFINRRKQFYAVGADIFKPYLKEYKRQGIHNEYVLCDVRHLPFADRSYDIVLCMEVLEHLEREEGKKLLSDMERIARKQVILSTPAGNYKQETYDENPHQEHKYLWIPREMRERGYELIGIGLRNLGGKSGIQSPLPRLLWPIMNFIWVLAGPVVYFLPGLAGDMVCKKKIGC